MSNLLPVVVRPSSSPLTSLTSNFSNKEMWCDTLPPLFTPVPSLKKPMAESNMSHSRQMQQAENFGKDNVNRPTFKRSDVPHSSKGLPFAPTRTRTPPTAPVSFSTLSLSSKDQKEREKDQKEREKDQKEREKEKEEKEKEKEEKEKEKEKEEEEEGEEKEEEKSKKEEEKEEEEEEEEEEEKASEKEEKQKKKLSEMEITVDLLQQLCLDRERSELGSWVFFCRGLGLQTVEDILGFDSYEVVKVFDPAFLDCLVKLKEFVEENMETPPTVEIRDRETGGRGLPEFQNWPDSLDSDINKKPNHPLHSKMVVFGEGEGGWGGNLVEGWNRKEYSVMKTQYEERKNRFGESVDSLQKEILSLFPSSSLCSSSSSTTLSSSSSPPPLPSSSPPSSSNLLGESLSSEEKKRVRLSWDHFAQRFTSYNPPHSPQLERSSDSHFHVLWLDFFLQVLVKGASVERGEKTLGASVSRKSQDAGKGVNDARFGKKVDMITTVGGMEYLAQESANEEFHSTKGEKDESKLMKEMHDMLHQLENDVKPLRTDGPWETWGIQTAKFGVKIFLLRGTHAQVSQVCPVHSFQLFLCDSARGMLLSEWRLSLSKALAVGVVLCRELNNLHERRMKTKTEFHRQKMRGSQRKTSSSSKSVSQPPPSVTTNPGSVTQVPLNTNANQQLAFYVHDQGVLIGNKMLESLYEEEEEGFDIISDGVGESTIISSAWDRRTKKPVVMKKTKGPYSDSKNWRMERAILLIAKNENAPGVVHLSNAFSSVYPSHSRLWFCSVLVLPRLGEVLWNSMGGIERIQQVIYEVGCGLEWLHSHFFVHLDVKHSNIMWDGERGSFVLIDFDTSHFTLFKTSYVGGTSGYRAPELEDFFQTSRGDEEIWVSPSADVYSLGIVYLLCLADLCGISYSKPLPSPPPFDLIQSILKISRHCRHHPHVLDDAQFVTKMVAVNPQQRPTAEQVVMGVKGFNSAAKTPHPSCSTITQQPSTHTPPPYTHTPYISKTRSLQTPPPSTTQPSNPQKHTTRKPPKKTLSPNPADSENIPNLKK